MFIVDMSSQDSTTTRENVLKRGNIRIRFSAFDSKLLDKSITQIVNHVKRVGGIIKGPIPLPNKIDKITVNRSPHVNKKSMEQFEIRKFRRLIEIVNVSQEITEQLANIDLPAGIDAEIKLNK
jgi:small subunit ribosomal protein S10